MLIFLYTVIYSIFHVYGYIHKNTFVIYILYDFYIVVLMCDVFFLSINVYISMSPTSKTNFHSVTIYGQ